MSVDLCATVSVVGLLEMIGIYLFLGQRLKRGAVRNPWRHVEKFEIPPLATDFSQAAGAPLTLRSTEQHNAAQNQEA